MSFFQILLTLTSGLGYTLLVTFSCIATGLLLGLFVALLSRFRLPWLAALLSLFTFVFRGVPVLVLLFLVFFGLAGFGLHIPALLAMMLSLGLVAGAYLAEVFRSALDAVDSQEIIAAEAMGMSRIQIIIHIELPQMLRFSVPGMLNEFTTVLKYSPFAYMFGIPDVMKQAMSLAATTLRGLEIYLAVGIIYFIAYKLIQFLVRLVEKRFAVPGFEQL